MSEGNFMKHKRAIPQFNIEEQDNGLYRVIEHLGPILLHAWFDMSREEAISHVVDLEEIQAIQAV